MAWLKQGIPHFHSLWHLVEALELEKKNKKPYSRIVFHEITKTAIENALKNPRKIDLNLVDAQQARRQTAGEFLEQLVVQFELLHPGLDIDRGNGLVLLGREIDAIPIEILVTRRDAKEVLERHISYRGGRNA